MHELAVYASFEWAQRTNAIAHAHEDACGSNGCIKKILIGVMKLMSQMTIFFLCCAEIAWLRIDEGSRRTMRLGEFRT
eukprot:CAMPEP_0202117008 /NCGR_PEP_ID=MMETSP0965-20130614/41887_1 /ASSEMBLY_ACC=CAM_ASM_000507 /TAXON_ID=4773 /ORGANISM="Schizochytrium aggregatum, Strain ATCC28209" /LENGTH=77 /DNA_ID=CAMNT_0048686897 /DNA_START=343 /DNA_END=576 /DNA_ORIENTATION=+